MPSSGGCWPICCCSSCSWLSGCGFSRLSGCCWDLCGGGCSSSWLSSCGCCWLSCGGSWLPSCGCCSCSWLSGCGFSRLSGCCWDLCGGGCSSSWLSSCGCCWLSCGGSWLPSCGCCTYSWLSGCCCCPSCCCCCGGPSCCSRCLSKITTVQDNLIQSCVISKGSRVFLNFSLQSTDCSPSWAVFPVCPLSPEHPVARQGVLVDAVHVNVVGCSLI